MTIKKLKRSPFSKVNNFPIYLYKTCDRDFIKIRKNEIEKRRTKATGIT